MYGSLAKAGLYGLDLDSLIDGLICITVVFCVASLTTAISSEIKAMVVAVVVEDGSGAGITTCCGALCAIV